MKKNTVTVVSLGICGIEKLTNEAVDLLKKTVHLYLRTEMIPCAVELKELGISWVSFDSYYDQYQDFDEMHEAMAKKLLDEASEHSSIVYAVIDSCTDASVKSLQRLSGDNTIIDIIPGISLFDLYNAACPELRDAEHVTVLPAASACETAFDQDQSYLITEIDSEIQAGAVKFWMENGYDDEASVVYIFASGKKIKSTVIPAMEADRQKKYDHTSALFIPVIPFEKRKHYSFGDLNRLMNRLRAFDGCPWDREQTHQSLKTYLLEEAWEVIGAIDSEDADHMADELGDLLLQIVFHASIGTDFDEFTIQDVIDHICRKMIFRHSHIFGSDSCNSADEVAVNWEKQKRIENGNKSVADSLFSVSEALPSLTYASKVIKKANQYPWWNERSSDFRKMILEKCGAEADSMIQTVIKCRDNSIDPELLLHQSVQKLIMCLQEAENWAKSNGNSLECLTNKELDVYFNRIER